MAGLAFTIACGSEREPQFADWLFPLPEGIPIIEHRAVPLEGRDPTKVRLVEDLVIGANLSNPSAILYRANSVVATTEGVIFIGDRGANDVKMFAPDGTFLKALGSEGQGPGEFGLVSSMTIAGDRLVVNDSRNRRYSLWTLDGEHVDEKPRRGSSLTFMQGLADGTLIGYFTERDENRVGRRVVVRRDLDGEEVARLFETDTIPPPVPISPNEPEVLIQRSLDASVEEPRVRVHLGPGDVVYLSPMHEYQLLAMSSDGKPRWAMRVAWPRLGYSDAQKESTVEDFTEIFPPGTTLRVRDFDWPAQIAAVSTVQTDGAGRIYVFPTPEFLGEQRREEWPVDVYAADGAFIAAGVVPNRWTYARGAYVYGTRPDALDETEVVRYRIVIDES